MNNLIKLSILVLSCDKYFDLWKPYFKLFWLNWKGCTYPVYLVSNKLKPNININTILTGQDLGWSSTLIKALEQVTDDYVLLLLDDSFIISKVDNLKFNNIINWVAINKPNYLHLRPVPRPDKPFDSKVGIISKGAIYRTSIFASIWNKNILKDLLIEGETAWEFEVKGTVRSDKHDHFYGTWEHYFDAINLVIKEKWDKRAIIKLNKLNIKFDTSKREIMSSKETYYLRFKEMRTKIFKMVPSKYRRDLKDYILNKLS